MLGHRNEERIRADERAKVENELQELAQQQSGGDAEQLVTSADRFDAVPQAERRAADGFGDNHVSSAEQRASVERAEEGHVGDWTTSPPSLVDQRVDGDPVVDRRPEPDMGTVPATAMSDDTVMRDESPAVERVIVPEQPVEVMRVRRFSLGQLMSMLAGLALLALGITAMATTGVRTPWDRPVESVFGWNHTPLLGILETAAGALLVLFSLRPGGRWLVGAVGLALIVGGVLILNEVSWATERLGAERNFGWAPIAVGGVAVLAALLTPRRYQRMTGVPVEPVALSSTGFEPARHVHA